MIACGIADLDPNDFASCGNDRCESNYNLFPFGELKDGLCPECIQMTDITMCTNSSCIIKEQCYRFTAIADSIQSFSLFAKDKVEGCDFYIDNNKE